MPTNASTRDFGAKVQDLILFILAAIIFLIGVAVYSETWSMMWWISTLICVSLALGVASQFSGKVKEVAKNLEDVFGTKPLSNILSFVLLSGAFVVIYFAVAKLLLPWVSAQLPSWDTRLILAFVALISLFAFPYLFKLYASAGLPGKADDLTGGRNGLMVATAIVFAIVIFSNPQGKLFNHETGEPLVMMSPDGSKIFRNLSPEKCAQKAQRVCIDEGTGDTLVPVTREVAKDLGFKVGDINPFAETIPEVVVDTTLTTLSGSLNVIMNGTSTYTVQAPFDKSGVAYCIGAFRVGAPDAESHTEISSTNLGRGIVRFELTGDSRESGADVKINIYHMAPGTDWGTNKETGIRLWCPTPGMPGAPEERDAGDGTVEIEMRAL